MAGSVFYQLGNVMRFTLVCDPGLPVVSAGSLFDRTLLTTLFGV
jgi:hypothetical protein